MSGNASRYSHQKARRFSQLILSQGAMVTDADHRESMAIGLRNTTALGATSIRTGVPQTEGLITWTQSLNPSSHKIMTGIRPGKVVADGHLGDVRLAEGAVLQDGPGLDLHHLQQDLLDAPQIDPGAGPQVLYADLWHRHVGPAEVARLVDPAFLSAETSTRTELMAQLKLMPLREPLGDAEVAARIQDNGLPRFGDFRLTSVEFTNQIVEPDECDPCAATLEDPNQEAGNSLFRLEVHRSSYNTASLGDAAVPAVPPDDTRIVLKWSNDNGSVEVPAQAAQSLLEDSSFDTAVFELTTLTGEQRMGLYTSGMTDRLASLHSRADIEDAIATAPEGAIVRVWDGAVLIDLDDDDLAVTPVGALSAQGSITVAGEFWTLQIALGGLDLTLVASAIETVPFVLPGDAWCVEIREYATDDGDKLIWEPEPVEIEHHYAFVGVTENGVFRNEDQPDMRARAFPALTELDALDIAYDNSQSEAEAWTVQGALDLLFARPAAEGHDCHCTFCIDPNLDLREQLAEIAAMLRDGKISGALICVPAGRFELSEPVFFDRGGAVTLRGAGRGLSVIEIAKVTPDSGALQFYELGSVRIEDISFAGDMNVDEPKALAYVIGVHEVGDFSVSRVTMRVARDDDGLAHGIAVSPLELDDAQTRVSVRDSAFLVAGNAQAVGVWRGASRLTIENNEFRAINIETLGGSGKLSAATDFVARTSVNRRTPEREAQIADGFFLPYPGNSEFLLNLTDLPPAARPIAERYWTQTLGMLEGGGEISQPKDFGEVQQALSVINTASRRLVEAEVMAISAKPAGQPVDIGRGAGRGRTRTEMPFLTALSDRQTRPVFAELGRNSTAGAGSFTAISAVLSAGGSIDGADERANRATAADTAVLELVGKADGLLRDNIKLVDFVETLGPVLDLIARTAEDGPPNWGIFSFTARAIPAVICGNRFVDLDVAVDLAAPNADFPADPFVAPIKANIADNDIRRILRMNRVFPPIWGNGADGMFDGQHPISILNYEDITVENNAISQIKPADMEPADLTVIYTPDFPDGMASFSAISFRGRLGPKMRAIGNAAFLMRHCVFLDGLPWKPSLDGDDPPSNHWVTRENSALPFISRELQQPAVFLEPKLDNLVGVSFHLDINDNWLPNPKFER